MNSKKHVLIYSVFTVLIANAGTVVDIGGVAGELKYTKSLAINNLNDVAGWAYFSSQNAFKVFRYSSGVVVFMQNTSTNVSTRISAINDSKIVVGSASYQNFNAPAKWLANGTVEYLKVGGQILPGAATDVNKNGLVVGYYQTAVGVSTANAVSWNSSGVSTTYGLNDMYFMAINDSNRVILDGFKQLQSWSRIIYYMDLSDKILRAFPSRYNNLGWMGNKNGDLSNNGLAVVINNSNDCGRYNTISNIDAPTTHSWPCFPVSVNSSGVYVGTKANSAGISHAFVSVNGVDVDLNTKISDPSWFLQIATGINDSGYIVGTGIHSGVKGAAFLYIP